MAAGHTNPVTGLTTKEEAFCREYVSNGYHGADAYYTVYGGSMGTAKARYCQILKKETAKNFIKEIQKEAFEAANISAERMAMKLAEMAFADKGDEVYTPSVVLKAMDLLQKQMGLQKQNINQDVKTTISVSVEETD